MQFKQFKEKSGGLFKIVFKVYLPVKYVIFRPIWLASVLSEISGTQLW